MNNFLKKQWSILLLLFFIIFGFYLRVGGVISNSFAFTYDVGRDLLEVQKIVQNFDIPLIGQTTGLGGLYYGPWWYYLLTPVFFISGGDPQAIALFMVAIGLGVIVLGYFFGKIISGKGLGLILASFLSFSSVMIGYSVQIWNPNVAPFFFLLFFIFTFKESKNKVINFMINVTVGFILGLLLDAEIVFGVLLIGGGILSLIILERKKLISLNTLFIFIGFFITLLPRIVFEIRHDFIMTKSLFISKSQEQQIFDFTHFFNVLPDRVGIFVTQIGETFGLNFYFSGVFVAFIFIVFIMCRAQIKKTEKKVILLSLIILGVFLVGSSFFARAIWGHYIVGLPIFYIIIVSILLLSFMRKYKKIGILLIIMLVFITVRPFDVIKSIENPYWEGNAAVYRNQIAVLDYIYKNAEGRMFNYIVYTPAVHDYPYQYLFSWYGKKKYGYVPQARAESLFYVVIEPDPGFEGRIKDWLRIREGDGSVMKEESVKGGIIVQTRNR